MQMANKTHQKVGEYRLKKVLSQLDEMATLPSPRRSPLLSHALHSPREYLPVTKFHRPEDRLTAFLEESVQEKQKERDDILQQPYRTTPLITPGAKTKPHLVNNKLTGKPMRPTVYRPLDEKSVVATLDENRALVNRQFNSPRSLYSNQNVANAIYEQTGVKMYPQPAKQFNPDASPTFQALLAEESRYHPGRLLPAPNVQQIVPPPKFAHSTAPSNHINSVGQPSARIAQSDSFRRLMLHVALQEY